ncbi:MAG TPA: AMP-binding protein, partial [Acidimicrobiales bacterium]|nr:AMP-binding protein [Acidimicrobiales bacterium]
MDTKTEPGATPYGARLTQLAQEAPDRVGMVFVAVDGTERAFTTAELDARANQVGRALAARGVGVGDRVGLELRNSPELVASLFGAWKVGA